MSNLNLEFFASEEGDAFGAFAYGQHDLQIVGAEAVREGCIARAQQWELEPEVLQSAREMITDNAPEHLWMRQEGDFEDSPYYFCKEADEGAIAITGWRLT